MGKIPKIMCVQCALCYRYYSSFVPYSIDMLMLMYCRYLNIYKNFAGDYQSVTVCQLPLYHAFAMNVTMGPALYGGAKIVMMPKFDPKVFSPALAKYKPTFLHLAPPLVSFVADSPLVGEEALSRLEHIVVAAAPSGPSLIAAFKAKAPKGVVYREG